MRREVSSSHAKPLHRDLGDRERRAHGPACRDLASRGVLSADLHVESEAIALLASALVFVAGIRLRVPAIRDWVLAFIIGFAPLSLWIWDVPFAGRPVCACCHDSKWVLPGIGSVHSRHVYLLSFTLFVVVTLVRWLLSRARIRGAAQGYLGH